jgi:crotonobetainyl-CoA:carnitine CoA-transferase CaiB-like acyl-CoA transferase
VPDGSLPLSDVTVLDLSDESTVFGARLLAELGARVIRIEDMRGDAIRSRGPFLRDEPGIERGLAHLLYNAGKQSVALDLESPAAWQLVERIALGCDVVVGPCGPRREIADLFETLEAAGDAPGIVDVVFRRDAPEELATDLIATAAGGLLVLGGYGDDPPNHPKGHLAYKQTSLAAAEAAVALVLEKRGTGRAGRIVVSMQEAVNLTTVQTANANIYHWHGRIPSRHSPVSPFTVHQTGDGLWISFTIHPPNWLHYVEWIESKLGSSDLSTEEWADSMHRATHAREMSEYTRRLLAQYTREEAIVAGQKRGLLVLPVNTIEDISNDRHLHARGFFETVSPAQLEQPLATFRSSFRSNAWQVPTAPAPSLGEHTSAVLGSLPGMSAQEINSLIQEGIAFGAPAARQLEQPPQVRPTLSPRGPEAVRAQPLKGVRILDFCWAIAGPLSTRLLADLGADVIKVESAYRLDPIRGIGVQPPGQVSWNTNGQFNDCNVNKRAMCLNLNTPEGIDIALKLAATADVVTSNYTPDRLDRWGLGYEALRAVKPDIILANLGVMGISGPHMGWRSYGSGIVAMCGIGALTGFPGRHPIGIGTLHTDFTVPYFAATAIMAAIHQRRRTGAGQYLELSQYEASVHLLDTELLDFLNGGPEPARNGNRSARMAPHGVYPSAGDDRWVAIACRDDADWARLSGLAGVTGPADLAGRLANLDDIESQLSEWTRTRDNWDVAAQLQQAGVPASPVEDLSELLGRDTAMNRDYRLLDLPSGTAAEVQEEPILWDGQRLPLARAPLWDEHTMEVLVQELGFSEERIAELLAANVLF